MKIAIVVHGRFHAFDLARELLRRGHDVQVFTNYPRIVVERFGIPRTQVHNYLRHGVFTRLVDRFTPYRLQTWLEPRTHQAFGQWALRQLRRQSWDAVLAFSGVAKEIFSDLSNGPLRVLKRGSSHIAVQHRLLAEEEARVGRPIDKPSAWRLEREQREYELADAIHVSSRFAQQSFLDEGVSVDKVCVVPLGVDVRRFRLPPAVIEERLRRINSDEPLRLLNVGTFSCRKGAYDWVQVLHSLPASRFRCCFVGSVAPDAHELARQVPEWVEFRSRVPQADLPVEYAWGDVFLLPTIEDGFAVVLAQAQAAGLPIVTTPNSAGPDLIEDGRTGWIVPIRDVGAIVDRLNHLDRNRAVLTAAVQAAGTVDGTRDWSEVAAETERDLLTRLGARTGARPEV